MKRKGARLSILALFLVAVFVLLNAPTLSVYAQDLKVTELTEDTAPGGDSQLYCVDDPAGTPVSRKCTLSNLSKGMVTSATPDTAPSSDDTLLVIDDPTGTPIPKSVSAANLTKALSTFVGDSGSGGTQGVVPAPAAGDSGKFLQGDGTWETPAGAGDVTAAASFGTDNTCIRADGSSKGVQGTSTNCSIDDNGNITANSITTGGGASSLDGTAGGIELGQGTAPSGLGTTSIQIIAPTGVTSYRITKPGAACSGVVRWVNSANIVTETCLDDAVVVSMKSSGTLSTGDGKDYFPIPSQLNGWNLTGVSAHVITVSSSGAITVDLARCATVGTGNTCSGTVVDMLSTNLTIDANESKSSTAATAAVIDGGNDDVSTDQVIRMDIDGAGTGATDLFLSLVFAKP